MSRGFYAKVAIVLLALGPGAVVPAPASAATVVDDHDLIKSTGKKKWTEVNSRKALNATLSRTKKRGATLATAVPAANGGSVTFQTGRKRGKFVLTVGAAKVTVKTSGRKVKSKTVDFTGAGEVRLTVKKPGRRGVYIDAITLEDSPDTSPPPAPDASVCPSSTTDGGTMTSALGTNLRICQLPGRVSSDLVLQKVPQVTYSLSGPVNVGTDAGGDPAAPLAGAKQVTLTIAAGVVVIANDARDGLIVNRGSQLNAVGSASQPIVFTLRANLAGTLSETSRGSWGGITMLGRAPISDCNTAVPGGSVSCQQVVEGTTSSLYGGASPNDSSGTLRYVQIRFPGFAIAPGNEFNGLTVAGVGQLTTLDHLQVVNSSDDGVEVFGGRPNLSTLALIGSDDDALDTDLGYRGTVQYVVGVQSDSQNGDSMIEADSNGNEDALPRQYTRVSNATFVAPSTVQGQNTVLFRGGTDYALLNSVAKGAANCLDIDGTGGTTTRGADTALRDLGPPVFRSVRLTCPTAFAADGNLQAETATSFGNGTNGNSSAHFNTLSGIVNGSSEGAVAATDPTTFNADVYAGTGQPNVAAPNRLQATTYVGAIQNASDPRFVGWTCNLSYVSFGSGVSCLTSPI